jgi:hypothetical protein
MLGNVGRAAVRSFKDHPVRWRCSLLVSNPQRPNALTHCGALPAHLSGNATITSTSSVTKNPSTASADTSPKIPTE